MKSNVKTAGLIVAMVMALGLGGYFTNEINAQGKTYKIGDRGPGGGYVFYDKGNSKGGWRYLEVAPVDQSTEAKWGCVMTKISGTGTGIGRGRANTRLIIKKCGETGIAAKVAVAYRGGGKSDWFLPSKDELNLIYSNLYVSEVVDFSYGVYYWSSSVSGNFSAWAHKFSGNHQHGYHVKDSPSGVRAVRAF